MHDSHACHKSWTAFRMLRAAHATSRPTAAAAPPKPSTAERCLQRPGRPARQLLADSTAALQGLPVVIDADGIGVVCMHPELVQGNPRAVLTPNAPEFWRLCDAFSVEHNNEQPHDSPALVQVLPTPHQPASLPLHSTGTPSLHPHVKRPLRLLSHCVMVLVVNPTVFGFTGTVFGFTGTVRFRTGTVLCGPCTKTSAASARRAFLFS